MKMRLLYEAEEIGVPDLPRSGTRGVGGLPPRRLRFSWENVFLCKGEPESRLIWLLWKLRSDFLESTEKG